MSVCSVCSRASVARESLELLAELEEPDELLEPPEEAFAGDPSETATISGPFHAWSDVLRN